MPRPNRLLPGSLIAAMVLVPAIPLVLYLFADRLPLGPDPFATVAPWAILLCTACWLAGDLWEAARHGRRHQGGRAGYARDLWTLRWNWWLALPLQWAYWGAPLNQAARLGVVVASCVLIFVLPSMTRRLLAMRAARLRLAAAAATPAG